MSLDTKILNLPNFPRRTILILGFIPTLVIGSVLIWIHSFIVFGKSFISHTYALFDAMAASSQILWEGPDKNNDSKPSDVEEW